MARNPSINILCSQESFRQLWSTVLAAGKLSVNFRQISVPPGHIPSTSLNIPCSQKTLCHLSVRLRHLPSIFVNILCGPETFRQLLSTFRATRTHSVYFLEHSVRPEDPPSPFHAAGRSSLNSRYLCMRSGDLPLTSVNIMFERETVRQLSSTLCAGRKPSVTFLNDWETICELTQLSVQPGELPSTFVRPGDLPSSFVNSPCIQETFRELPLTFHAKVGPFVNFHQISVCLRDLLSTFHAGGRPSINLCQFPFRQETFRQLPPFFRAAWRPSVSSITFLCGRETFHQLSSTFHAV